MRRTLDRWIAVSVLVAILSAGMAFFDLPGFSRAAHSTFFAGVALVVRLVVASGVSRQGFRRVRRIWVRGVACGLTDLAGWLDPDPVRGDEWEAELAAYQFGPVWRQLPDAVGFVWAGLTDRVGWLVRRAQPQLARLLRPILVSDSAATLVVTPLLGWVLWSVFRSEGWAPAVVAGFGVFTGSCAAVQMLRRKLGPHVRATRSRR